MSERKKIFWGSIKSKITVSRAFLNFFSFAFWPSIVMRFIGIMVFVTGWPLHSERNPALTLAGLKFFFYFCSPPGTSARWTRRPRDYCSPDTWRPTWASRSTGNRSVGRCRWRTVRPRKCPKVTRCSCTSFSPKCLTRRWNTTAVTARRTDAYYQGCRTYRLVTTVSARIAGRFYREPDTCGRKLIIRRSFR